ncbi:MAG TPA: GNAT family N-acetyltransferase [Nostoc sp.]|uniref:GNAT family N-acetyltransferase n=1 Tax=Nostoc sp. TaxID=1180 RepID=UPI002D27CFB4|nr:GNAT family N-acetyltransferase [Nostoc sp.]HYX18588.1 GNAT family N-acetyltransferase [Nostoc sp.]
MSNDFSLSSFPELETERLLLRETTLQDAEAIFAVFSDPGVTQFHDLDTFTSIEEAMSTTGYAYALIGRRAKRFELGDGIRWGIFHKQDNVLIGFCGFQVNPQEQSARSVMSLPILFGDKAL